MRILWISDSPEMQQVGQSRVGREFCYRFAEAGLDVHVAGYIPPTHQENKTNEIKSFKVHDCQRYDTEATVRICKAVKPNIIVLSHDPFMYKCVEEIRKALKDTVSIVGYFTIDGDPIPHVFKDIFYACDHVVLPSEYGQRVVTERFFDLSTSVIPYGVNMNSYNCADKAEAKKGLKKLLRFGLEHVDFENKLIFTYVGNNQGRKNVGVARDAFKEFVKGKEKDVMFLLAMKSVILTEGDFSFMGFYDLNEFEHSNIRVAGFFLKDEIVANLYKVSDFLVHPSIGEGFGLTLMEAMASRCVPITTNYSAMTDFCHDENTLLLDDFVLMRGEFDVHRAIVTNQCMFNAFDQAYDLWKNDQEALKEMQEAGVKTANQYDWDDSAQMFMKLFQELQLKKINKNQFEVVRV